MNAKLHLTKRKMLSASIVIIFGLFCYFFSNNIVSLAATNVPLSSGNIEAMFYIENSDNNQLTCIGDGLINSTTEIINDASSVEDKIITSPNYLNYIMGDCVIQWHTILRSNNEYQVIGKIVSLDNDSYSSQFNTFEKTITTNQTLYFSTSGSDSNDGLSASSPKRNPEKYLKDGNYTILLKSGDTFFFNSSLSLGSNVKLSTYGEGRAACAFQKVTTNTFKPSNYGQNIYSVKLNNNDTDTGWISIDGTRNWKKKLSNSLENDNEYYIDTTNGLLFLRSDTKDLTGKNLTYASAGNGIVISSGNNCYINNIEISGSGYHGVSIVNYSNVLIQNCFIHDIGGGIQKGVGVKYGNGLQIWATNSSNIYIYKNIVTNCFDAGLTAQIDDTQKHNSENIIFANNLVEHCNYGVEFFQYGTSYSLKDIVVDNNIIFDSKDITNGYRFTKSSTDYTAFICLWGFDNHNDSIVFKNNLGLKSQNYAISHSYKLAVLPCSYIDNKLITSNPDSIKYPSNYSGDASQCFVYAQNSPEYKTYYDLYTKIRLKYNTSQLLK